MYCIMIQVCFFFFFSFFSFFGLFRAEPSTCGSSQARGWIWAVAAGLQPQPQQHQSWICDLCFSSQQCWILNLLSEAKDQTPILMDTSWAHNPLSHNGNSWFSIFAVIFHYDYYKIMTTILSAIQCILVYFIYSSLYLLIPYP